MGSFQYTGRHVLLLVHQTVLGHGSTFKYAYQDEERHLYSHPDNSESIVFIPGCESVCMEQDYSKLSLLNDTKNVKGLKFTFT